jgi:prophage regulatory protein
MKIQYQRMNNVAQVTSLSKSTIYREMNAGRFPKSIKLTESTVAWLKSEVDDWLLARLELRTKVEG